MESGKAVHGKDFNGFDGWEGMGYPGSFPEVLMQF
jgi:hypothetical protein